MSNGRYAEFKNVKRIETIGSVRFNTERKKIVGFGENKRQVEVVSRFLSVDPLARSYPFYSPYQFAGNKPIVFIDIDGAEEGFNIRFEQMQVGYLKGKVTKQELKDFNKANAAGALVGAGVVGAAYAAPIVASAASKYGVGLMLNPVAQANIIGFFYGLAGGEDELPFTGGNNAGKGVRKLAKNFTNYGGEFVDDVVHSRNYIASISKTGTMAVFKGDHILTGTHLKLDDEGLLYGTIKIAESGKGKGIATQIFKDAAKLFGEKVKGIKATWLDSDNIRDNYDAFMKVYKETGNEIDAAFATATGKIAKKMGFTKAEVIFDDKKPGQIITKFTE